MLPHTAAVLNNEIRTQKNNFSYTFYINVCVCVCAHYYTCIKKYNILIDNEHYIIIVDPLFEFRVYYVSDQIYNKKKY